MAAGALAASLAPATAPAQADDNARVRPVSSVAAAGIAATVCDEQALGRPVGHSAMLSSPPAPPFARATRPKFSTLNAVRAPPFACRARDDLHRLRARAASGSHAGMLPDGGILAVRAVAPEGCTGESAGLAARTDIEAVVVGDGSAVDESLQLLDGRLHASAQAVASAMLFHPIDVDDDLFAGEWRGRVELDTYAVPGTRAEKTCINRPPSCVVLAERELPLSWSGLRREEAAELTILRFLFRFPGVAVVTHHIGSRPAVAWTEKQKMRVPGLPFSGGGRHSCVESAIINAVALVSGHDAAGVVQEVVERHPRRFRSLKPLGSVLALAGERQVRCKVAKDPLLNRALSAAAAESTFDLVCQLSSGVFVARLRRDEGTDYAVVIDAQRRLIIDGVDEHCVKLTPENLRICGGVEMDGLRVLQICKIEPSEHF